MSFFINTSDVILIVVWFDNHFHTQVAFIVIWTLM